MDSDPNLLHMGLRLGPERKYLSASEIDRLIQEHAAYKRTLEQIADYRRAYGAKVGYRQAYEAVRWLARNILNRPTERRGIGTSPNVWKDPRKYPQRKDIAGTAGY